MKNKIIIGILFFCVTWYTQLSSAKGVNMTQVNASADGKVPTNSGSSTPSLQDSAGGAKGAQGGAAGMNSQIGSMLMSVGTTMAGSSDNSTREAGIALIALGGAAMMQSSLMSSTAGKSGGTQKAVQYNTSAADTSDPTLQQNAQKAKATIAALESQGYKVAPDGTVTTPDGQVVTPSSVSSADSMAKAGYSPDAIMKTQSELKKVVDKVTKDMPTTMVSGGEESGGGGAGFNLKPANSQEAELQAHYDPDALKKRGPAQLAGMQKNFNGEPVGVAGDNIFDMINRRYELKDKQDFFLRDADSYRK